MINQHFPVKKDAIKRRFKNLFYDNKLTSCQNYEYIYLKGYKQGYRENDSPANLLFIGVCDSLQSSSEQLSLDLQAEFPGVKGFSARNLWFMKQWYVFYATEDSAGSLISDMESSINVGSSKLKQVASEIEIRLYKIQEKKEVIMQLKNNESTFLIKYAFIDETRETELKILVNGVNILSFCRNNYIMTTQWNLDDIALWLRNFIDHLSEDPYPVEADGEYAAIKDINAREFDSDDDEEFDAYYDKLDEWNARHRWHPASQGAILADLYFQLVDDMVEISWNNQDAEEGVFFTSELGGVSVRREVFCNEVNSFLKEYSDHWFGNI